MKVAVRRVRHPPPHWYLETCGFQPGLANIMCYHAEALVEKSDVTILKYAN